jgi:hypothetical protein
MKNVLFAAALLVGSVAFAEGAAPAAPAASAKMTKKAARQECLKENKDLKGAKLSECVKNKTK